MAKKKIFTVPASPITTPPSPYLHDIPTAAALMSTTIFAVRELCRSGKLKFVAIGHRWLISPQAIQEFIHENEQAAGNGESGPRRALVLTRRK